MATHSSLLAWRIPATEEPGGLQSVGSQKSWPRLQRLSWQQASVTCLPIRESIPPSVQVSSRYQAASRPAPRLSAYLIR